MCVIGAVDRSGFGLLICESVSCSQRNGLFVVCFGQTLDPIVPVPVPVPVPFRSVPYRSVPYVPAGPAARQFA